MKMSIHDAIDSWDSTQKSVGKLFFSYDVQDGWTLKELNLFQRILRYCFGMYASTHLKTIRREYTRFSFDQLVNLSTIQKIDRLGKAYFSSLSTIDRRISYDALRQNISADMEMINSILDRLKLLEDGSKKFISAHR